MIANVSPAASTFEDTYNTLKYANRAKKIKTNLSRNVLSVQYHISKYSNIISSLKSEINELKLQLQKKENKSSDSTQSLISRNTNITSNPLTQIFEKLVNELKAICDDEISLKNRLYDQEQSCHNLKMQKESKENNTDNESIKLISKSIDSTKDKLKTYSRKRDGMMSQWNKTNNNPNDIQTKYLNSILKEHNIKILQIENKIKENYNFEVVNNKDSYITELELQIKIRDDLINKNMILEELQEPVKSIEEIKKDYSKLPMIYVKDKAEDIKDISQLVYVNRNCMLPPICDTSVNQGKVKKIKKSSKAVTNNINLNFQKGT